jgi:HTH-type transcriptional regulator / antitoxin HigA
MGTGSQERVRFEPDYAFPPGDFLSERLEELGMTQAELSRRTGISQKHLSQLVNGEVALSPTTALRLEKVTRMPAYLWNRLEATYQTSRSKQQEAAELNSAQARQWAEKIPYKELISREHLSASDAGTLVERLLSFFGVGSLDAWDAVFDRVGLAHYRQAEGGNKNAATIATWLRVCELRAERIHTADFDRDRFASVLATVRHVAVKEPKEWWPELVDALATAGVALVLEPEFPGKTELNGASWWASPRKAVVALTGRRKKADGMLFTLLHESAHILKHSKKQTFINAEDGVPRVEEQLEDEANRFASRLLVPPEVWSRVERIPRSNAAYALVQSVAKEFRIHPGIIAGQLQARVWKTNTGAPDYGFCNRVKQTVDLSEPFWEYTGA